MKLDDLASQVYVVALNEARLQNHEYLTPEHFLYAALMFDSGKEIIETSGGNVKNIIKDLCTFFEENMPRKVSEQPLDSFEFIRMLELATAQLHSSGKQVVQLGDLLAAAFNLQESFAVYIMLENGVDRLSLLKCISAEERREQATANNVQKRDKNREFLQMYTTNFTERARAGYFDPLIGREDVLERTVHVLCRRMKNNPVHVGEPGVGKTAVVEGLSQMIADGNVPELLKDSQIYHIDIGVILAGTRYRGDFEERLIKLLDIISKTKKPIIYIDEIHTVVGAGAISGGGLDATNILKPYLSRGEVRFIGSTTFDEYKKHFEKDRALSRRFQRIDIEEPTQEQCVAILKGLKKRYEEFHNVIYTDEIIKLICSLSSKYMQDRFLPDKAIDVMDEAGAMQRLNSDKEYVKVVTVRDVERTVAKMAKIPETTITDDESAKLKNLEQNLKTQIFGQDKAVETVVNAILTSRSGLNDPDKPVASLLFVGPTGVGKTELAKQLAELLNVKLLRYDMSEYQEKHSVARLIGSPPGYVGYEEGGLLTESVRKTPHAVILLDEIEKAHPDIYNVLLQIMDYASLTDNMGKKADFRNTVLIMTSNAGAREMNKRIIGFDETGGKTLNVSAIDKEVERVFSPEFRNRLDAAVVFNSIDKKMAKRIAVKALNRLVKRLENKNISVEYSGELVDYLSEKGMIETFGAREIIRAVDTELKNLLANEVLFGQIPDSGTISLGYKNGKVTASKKKSRSKSERVNV